MNANNLTRRVKKRPPELHRPSLELVQDFASTVYLRIEVPLPFRELNNWRRGFYKLLTGDEFGQWNDFSTGKKVSPFTLQLAYLFCVSVYFATQFLFFNKPELLAPFWAFTYLILFLFRIDTFMRTARTYYLLDYCYVVALLTVASTVLLRDNMALWKTTFALATGIPLVNAFIYPKHNALTFSSVDSVSHLCSNFLHTLPGIVMYVDLKLKNDAGQTVTPSLKESVLYPLAVYSLWQVCYLFWTELVDFDIVYRRPKIVLDKMTGKMVNLPGFVDYGTSLKYQFGYNKTKPKELKFRYSVASMLKKIGLLKSIKSVDGFIPDKNKNHHLIALAVHVLYLTFFEVILFPVSFLFLQNKTVFAAYLLLMVLKLCFNGAKLAFPDTVALKDYEALGETLREEEAVGSTAQISAPEVYNEFFEDSGSEGGDEPGDSWSKGRASTTHKVNTTKPEEIELSVTVPPPVKEEEADAPHSDVIANKLDI